MENPALRLPGSYLALLDQKARSVPGLLRHGEIAVR